MPTGAPPTSAGSAAFAPSIAHGKGWGGVDVQGTVGVTLPTAITSTLGRTLVANDTFQVHTSRYWWPEIEVNTARFISGPHHGQTQVFVTPALLVGRLHVSGRVGLTFGLGLQFATTKFHTSNHNLLATARLPF